MVFKVAQHDVRLNWLNAGGQAVAPEEFPTISLKPLPAVPAAGQPNFPPSPLGPGGERITSFFPQAILSVSQHCNLYAELLAFLPIVKTVQCAHGPPGKFLLIVLPCNFLSADSIDSRSAFHMHNSAKY